jgi:xanthine dehydrogenase YagS FAD-binding subunit
MRAFAYKNAATVEEAVKLLSPTARPLAGGTSLVNLMKERIVEPELVVNLKSIKGLDALGGAAGSFTIGANATITAILESSLVRQQYPALAQALETMGTPQIRNMATLGGNLCAPTPCLYFSNELCDCPRRGKGATCPAKKGDNEFMAIFETDGPCVSVAASSAAPALIALGAKVRVAGPKGTRELEVEKLYVAPKTSLAGETVLAPNEIITHVLLGAPAPRSATYEVRHRGSHDWPVSLASVALAMQGANVASARVVLGAVAPTPWRAAGAEKALAGKPVTPEAAAAAAEAAVAGAAPLAQNAYKVQTAKAAVRRAILLAATGKWS